MAPMHYHDVCIPLVFNITDGLSFDGTAKRKASLRVNHARHLADDVLVGNKTDRAVTEREGTHTHQHTHAHTHQHTHAHTHTRTHTHNTTQRAGRGVGRIVMQVLSQDR
jgi:hypothetical protein